MSVSEARIYKNIIDFLRDAPRKSAFGLVVATSIFVTNISFVPNANAGWVPGVGSNPIVPDGGPLLFFKDNATNLGLTINDFDPHYNFFLFRKAPSVTPWFSRKAWCLPQWKVPVIGICIVPTLGLGRGWCEDTAGCSATNVLNLLITLEILHSDEYIGRDGRLDDASSTRPPADLPDYTARDACVHGASLSYKKFDSKTGQLKESGAARYDETATGDVLGSKPDVVTCMQTINTPKAEAATGGPLAFTYYQNADNYPFKSEGNAPKDIYGNSNRCISTNFFLGGNLGCPESLFANDEPEIKDPQTAEYWRKKADKCYSYFVFGRATHPEWVLERPGESTDDPLTQDKDGSPDKAIYNSCQTLMSGANAKDVANGASPVGKGFSPVMQYTKRADLDEADYAPADILKRDFSSIFPGQKVPEFSNLFPCLKTQSDGGLIRHTDWSTFNDLLDNDYLATAVIEAGFLGKYQGPVLFRRMDGDMDYKSPGIAKDNFCPNVERIISPGNPFSPRDAVQPDPEAQKMIYAPFSYNWGKNDNALNTFRTDRQYSYLTNWYTTTDRMLNFPFVFGYSGWMDTTKLVDPIYLGYFALYAKSNGTPDMAKLTDFAKHPEVQCAIVPVDVIEPRRAAFNNCIMQRINYNYITWRRTNFLGYYYKRALRSWSKPCVTRFYESDSYDKCPVSMSIQQCCRIIVKDVVPMNHLKIRTCEGLRQKRKLLFGYDHIFDATLMKKVQVTVPDEDAIKAAKEALLDLQLRLFWSEDSGHPEIPKNAYCQMEQNIPGGVEIPLMAADPYVSGIPVGINSSNTPTVLTMPLSATPACTVWAGKNCFSDKCNQQGNLNNLNQALRDAKKKTKTVEKMEPVAVTSPGGKYVKTPTSQAEYDAVYQENQKLTLIGCDDTEPDDYRFSTHFELSKWAAYSAKIDLSIINVGMNKIQDLSDKLLTQVRDVTTTSLFNKLTDVMWYAFDSVNKSINNLVLKAKFWAGKALQAQQNLEDRVRNAEMLYESVKDPGVGGSSVTIPRALMIINDPTLAKTAAIAKDFVIAKAELLVITPITSTVYKGVDMMETKKNELAESVENTLRDAVQTVLDKREELLLLGKKKADQLILDGVKAIQDKVNEKMSNLIDDLLTKIYANEASALAATVMGEGGAHMPYMRWWDTGTSAGNPTHGGSFINTLGSYDTIIGVGHEERDFFDATEVVTKTSCPAKGCSEIVYECTKTVRDTSALAAAQKALSDYYQSHDPSVCNGGNINGGCLPYPYESDVLTLVANINKAAQTTTTTTFTDPGGCVSTAPDDTAYNNAKSDLDQYVATHTGGTNECEFNYVNPCGAPKQDPAVVNSLTADVITASNQVVTSPANTKVIDLTVYTKETSITVPLKAQQSLTTTSKMGRLGGWTELKAHQMWTTRRSNLACIGRYEKLFKPGGQEDFVLGKAGANYVSKDGKQWSWPLAWRGYVGDPNNDFERHAAATGLDNAQRGDIIIYSIGGFKRIAYVTGANQSDPKYVQIQSWDNGKFPTSAGSGISWGMGTDRTIYKDSVPEDSRYLTITTIDNKTKIKTTVSTLVKDTDASKVAKIGENPSCVDPNFSACVLGGDGNSTWDDVIIYRPSEDTERLRCPMADYSQKAVNVQTMEKSTNSFAYCVNAGFDPPADYAIGNYKGAGAGAISDATLCGPNWTECDSSLELPAQADQIKCFPGGDVCKPNVLQDPGAPPAPGGSSGCTTAELDAARADYEKDAGDRKTALANNQAALDQAKANAQAAAVAYNDYSVFAAKEQARLNVQAITGKPTIAAAAAAAVDPAKTALINLDNAITALDAAESNVQTAHNNYSSYLNNNKATLDKDNNIVENMADPANPTPQEQAAADEAQSIRDNLVALGQTVSDAMDAVSAAKDNVKSAQAAFDALPTSQPGAAPDPAIEAALQDKKKAMDDAEKAATDAQTAVDNSSAAMANVPPLKCPAP